MVFKPILPRKSHRCRKCGTKLQLVSEGVYWCDQCGDHPDIAETPHGVKADGTPYQVPPDDSRRRPRKPVSRRQTRTIGITVTEAEYGAIHTMADENKMTVRELILNRLFSDKDAVCLP